ncbi:hypothetical protein F4553_000201 [Allocatelliglobosispora scoriae]|uniref:Peptidase C51 domain-containing protein n=1 Tax=Allocatelliglobosispora scoriae TaxID=643052 RepID=A0A841BJ67_9ACTN|nr:CHAP domain-containing protein [Allocatelliglobosispora scoriae]MBB5866822.1 hypothetical protein [Allocatelliglobosispora scoriae]
MTIKKLGARRWSLLLAAVLSANALSIVAPAAPAQAAAFCECVKYVKTRYTLTHVGDAYQWEGFLPLEGWTKMTVGTARVGDIVVWDQWEMPQWGHIAIVQAIYGSSQGLSMVFRGSNQAGTKFTQNNCNNVSDWSSTTAWGNASFFHK